ncbi:hypothetical protein PT273_00385 [Orbaceae bacterium ESL0727]|nr:hypothetical protein [Orbaceae bacterium ESL0727]
MQQQFNDCNKNRECEKQVYNEYIQKEQEAGQKLVEMYKSGQLTKEDYEKFVGFYTDAMLEGTKQNQINNNNHDVGGWDINDASAMYWTQGGIAGNPYLAEIRARILLDEWKAQGLSEQQIQEKFLKDNVLGSLITTPDVNTVVQKIRNGLSIDNALILASSIAYNKVLDSTTTGKVNGGSSSAKAEESLSSNKLDKDYFESQYGKDKVEQGFGNNKETKDKLYDGQYTNQQANQSSNFSGHIKNEKELDGKLNSNNVATNAATYPKFKDDLIQQNLNNLAKQDSRLAAVVKGNNGKLNYGVGTGTTEEANRLGMQWVGGGAKKTSDGGWISADGTRGYRPPSNKPNSHYAETGIQANFETYKFDVDGKRTKVGNGHLNIKD